MHLNQFLLLKLLFRFISIDLRFFTKFCLYIFDFKELNLDNITI